MFGFDSPWQKDEHHPLEILESICKPKSAKQNKETTSWLKKMRLTRPGFKRTSAWDDMQNNRSQMQPAWLRNNNETPTTSSGFLIHVTNILNWSKCVSRTKAARNNISRRPKLTGAGCSNPCKFQTIQQYAYDQFLNKEHLPDTYFCRELSLCRRKAITSGHLTIFRQQHHDIPHDGR